jgi:outer membrane immunogenic protein
MRNRSLSLFAAATIGLTSSQVALAADLARPLPPAPAYTPPEPIPYIWTGCYVGGNIGGIWSNVELNNISTAGTASASNSGVAGGGQIGCDYQTGGWVFGIRNMFDATSLSNNGRFSTVSFSGTADSRTQWFDTLTARGGYLVAPAVLLYVQGGAAVDEYKGNVC